MPIHIIYIDYHVHYVGILAPLIIETRAMLKENENKEEQEINKWSILFIEERREKQAQVFLIPCFEALKYGVSRNFIKSNVYVCCDKHVYLWASTSIPESLV